MEKVPFNQDGLNSKIEIIYTLTKEEYRNELCKMQFEIRQWVIDNFALNDDQVRFVYTIPEEILDPIAHATVYAILEKKPIELKVPDVYENPMTSKRGVKATVQIQAEGTWSPGESPNVNYNINAGISISVFNPRK